MQVVFIALSTVALSYLALCTALLVFQRSLLYFPQPSSLGGRDTTISLRVADIKIVASVRPRVGPDAVIYFGGNGEDVTASVPGLMEASPHHALYLLHYRGYGGSAGTPSEAASSPMRWPSSTRPGASIETSSWSAAASARASPSASRACARSRAWCS